MMTHCGSSLRRNGERATHPQSPLSALRRFAVIGAQCGIAVISKAGVDLIVWGVTSLEIIVALNIDWKDRIKIRCRIVEDRLMHFTWNKFAICLSQYGIAGIQLIHWKIRPEHHAIGAELI